MIKPTTNKSSEIISFFTTLLANPKAAIMIVFTSVPAILGAGYLGVTKYNQVITIIETNDAKEKSIADLKAHVAVLQKDNEILTKAVDAQHKIIVEKVTDQVGIVKSRLESVNDTLVKVQDKTSEALMNSRDGKVMSESTQKEVRSQLSLIRAEVNAALEAVKAEMQIMKRATSNPLGG